MRKRRLRVRSSNLYDRRVDALADYDGSDLNRKPLVFILGSVFLAKKLGTETASNPRGSELRTLEQIWCLGTGVAILTGRSSQRAMMAVEFTSVGSVRHERLHPWRMKAWKSSVLRLCSVFIRNVRVSDIIKS